MQVNDKKAYQLTDISSYLGCVSASVLVFSSCVALKGSSTINQSKQIRHLLNQVLTDLNWDDELDDSQFPYRLKKTKHIVSFSHSANDKQLNLLGMLSHPVLSGVNKFGVDTEMRMISPKVVSRFFSKNEQHIIGTLKQQDKIRAIQLLWMAKEAHIKTSGLNLLEGLAVDISKLIDMDLFINTLQASQKNVQGVAYPLTDKTANTQKTAYKLKTGNTVNFVWLPTHNGMLCFQKETE